MMFLTPTKWPISIPVTARRSTIHSFPAKDTKNQFKNRFRIIPYAKRKMPRCVYYYFNWLFVFSRRWKNMFRMECDQSTTSKSLSVFLFKTVNDGWFSNGDLVRKLLLKSNNLIVIISFIYNLIDKAIVNSINIVL